MSQALVTLSGVDRGFSRQTVADGSGRFSFGFVEPGSYELRAEALGFRPVLITPVYVNAGDATDLGIELQPTAPPVDAIDTVAVPGAAPSVWRRDGIRVGRARIAELPDPYDAVSALASLSSRSDPYLGSEGLPGELSLLIADGVPFRRATHPAMRGEELSTAMLSRVALADVDALGTPSDIEWSGSAGGIVALTTRSAGTELAGGWSGAPVWSSSTLDLEAPSLTSYWGRGAAGVELKPDTSRMFIAGEALQVENPLEPRLSSAAAALLPGLDAGLAAGLAEPAVQRTRRASGIARLDWALDTGRRLTLRASAGHLEREFSGFGPTALLYGGAPPESATDFSAVGEFVSAYDRGPTLELRGGVTGSSRTYDVALPGIPATTFVGSGLSLGGPPAADVSRIDVDLSPLVHYPIGPGTIKGGVSVRMSSHNVTFGPFAQGQYYLSDPDAAAAGAGVLTKSNGATESSFSTTEVGAFGQYAFDLSPGLRLTLGGRLDYEAVPKDQVTRNTAWVQASGVLNDDYPTGLQQWGGIGALSWDLVGDARTMLEGAFSLIHGDMDPVLLHETFTHDGGLKISRYAGSGLDWPETSVPARARTVPTLTLLGPDSRAPRSTRATLELIHHAGDGWNLHVGGSVRRTDFLSRRRNLNLTTFPLAVDSHGRAVLGELMQFGSVIAVDPGSNRRFSGFDEVWTIDTDGWSEYRGATVGLEHRGPMLDLFASYTRSQTRDNWVGAGAGVPEAQLPPGLPGDGDWTEGTSDFDVPDRLVAGASLGMGPGRTVSVTGVFRYESGLPFTPGYRAGVDVNGDGSALNDVAWVPGSGELSGLLSDWPCLNSQTDAFAERNSCRGPARTSLDVGVRARLGRLGGRPLVLTVDGFGLIEREDGLRDTALLLVDPAGSITTSGDGGMVTLPLRVNPDFGKLIVPTGLGRVIRIGLRLGGGS